MAMPDHVAEFINITGAPESVAVQKLEVQKVDILHDSSDAGLPQTCESLPPLTSHQQEVTKVAAFEPIRQTGWIRNDFEKERIKAQASRNGWEGVSRWKQTVCNGSSECWLPTAHVQHARAIEFSIETAKKEKAAREKLVEEDDLGVHDLVDNRKKTNSSRNHSEVADDLVSPQAVEESKKR